MVSISGTFLRLLLTYLLPLCVFLLSQSALIDVIMALAEKDRCPLYEAWQQTRFHDQKAENRIMAALASRSKFELFDLTTPEPRHD
jgi:hypothetical protein